MHVLVPVFTFAGFIVLLVLVWWFEEDDDTTPLEEPKVDRTIPWKVLSGMSTEQLEAVRRYGHFLN